MARLLVPPIPSAIVVAAVLLWVPGVGFGVHKLLRYASTPGRPAVPPDRWPHDAAVRREPGRATLVIFAHPQCPCSRATIGELAVIMAKSREIRDAFVFFYSPQSKEKAWAIAELWRDAEAIPGVKPIEDVDGREAIRFGAHTSGQTLLYDATGSLTFNGGITGTRGMPGSNDGRDTVLSLIGGKRARHRTAPAFGCSLLEKE